MERQNKWKPSPSWILKRGTAVVGRFMQRRANALQPPSLGYSPFFLLPTPTRTLQFSFQVEWGAWVFTGYRPDCYVRGAVRYSETTLVNLLG